MKPSLRTPSISESRAATGVHAEGLAKHRILIVDDDPSVREMLTRVLEGEGYCVCAAACGEEALESITKSHFDLLLLDLKMPRKGGWDIFERISEIAPLLSVIVITGQSNQLFTALCAGVGALLEKPLDFPQLLQTTRNLLAEPEEIRLARRAGRRADFHYVSGRAKGPTQ